MPRPTFALLEMPLEAVDKDCGLEVAARFKGSVLVLPAVGEEEAKVFKVLVSAVDGDELVPTATAGTIELEEG